MLDHLNPDVLRPGPERLLFLDHPAKKISASSGHGRVHRRSQANDVQEGCFKPLQAMKHISGPSASHEGGGRSRILLHECLLFFSEIGMPIPIPFGMNGHLPARDWPVCWEREIRIPHELLPPPEP